MILLRKRKKNLEGKDVRNGNQRPSQRPTYDHGNYQKRDYPNGRTTTTSQKPSPGHKK